MRHTVGRLRDGVNGDGAEHVRTCLGGPNNVAGRDPCRNEPVVAAAGTRLAAPFGKRTCTPSSGSSHVAGPGAPIGTRAASVRAERRSAR